MPNSLKECRVSLLYEISTRVDLNQLAMSGLNKLAFFEEFNFTLNLASNINIHAHYQASM